MENTITFTTNEEAVINVLAETEKAYDVNGEVGFSDVMVSDIVAQTGFNVKTVKGILGSLVKKELVYYSDVNGEYNIYYLTGTTRKHLGMEPLF